jgi:hypothetical protein
LKRDEFRNIGRRCGIAAILPAALALGGARLASATAIAVTNADLENPPVADPDGFAAGGPVGWPTGGVGSAGGGVIDPGTSAGAVFAGENNLLYQDAFGDSFANTTQVTPATIQPNMRYTLSLQVANDQTHLFPTVGDGDTTGRLLTRLVDASTNTGLSAHAGVTLVSTTAAAVPAGSIGTYTLVYDTDGSPANAGNGLYIQLFTQGRADNPSELTRAMFDNVSLDVSPVPVPEPATVMGACALAGAALLGRRRRRRGGGAVTPEF